MVEYNPYHFQLIPQKQRMKVLLILPITLIVLALILGDIKNVFKGLYLIIVNPSILITDYLEIGGLSATFINSALITLFNIYLLHKLKMKVSGITIAAIFITCGFAFFGKNLFNIWPIYLGGYLYSVYQNIKFKNVVIISIFGTALSPLVNEIVFGLDIPLLVALPSGLIVGTLIGFIMPALSSHMLRVHDGYNLYNIGFASGLLGTIIFSLLRSFGFRVESQMILSTKFDLLLKIYMLLFFFTLIIIGYVMNAKSFKNYSQTLTYIGRLITDFTQLVGFGLTLVNMGFMGLISMFYVIISNGTLNGPIVGALLTVVGFAAFGKHPKNSIPILLGVYIAGLTKIWDVNSTVVIISGLFGTALAPIAGEYKWYRGVFAGFLHLSIVMNVGALHGGLNLYNNGFSAGIVASILVPIYDAFVKEDN